MHSQRSTTTKATKKQQSDQKSTQDANQDVVMKDEHKTSKQSKKADQKSSQSQSNKNSQRQQQPADKQRSGTRSAKPIEEVKETKLQKQEIKNEDQQIRMCDLIISESSKERSKFQGIREENSNNQVCQVCYQIVLYPETKEEESDKTIEGEDDKNEEDAKWLYRLAYCQDCSAPAHWNCIGPQVQLQEYNKGTQVYYTFKCDKCSIKKLMEQNPKVKLAESDVQKQYHCRVCEQKEGLLFGINVSQNEEDQQYLFIHYICAISAPSVFGIEDSAILKFVRRTSNNDWSAWSQHGKRKTAVQDCCTFCSSPNGILLKCASDQSCGKRAHAFCIANKLKDYLYASANEIGDPDKDYETKWSFQIQANKENKLDISTYCNEHQLAVKYCHCQETSQSELVLCDFCQNWYHNDCLEFDAEAFEDKEYRCDKCTYWLEHIQNPLLDILLKRKTYKQLQSQDQTEWEHESLSFDTDPFYKAEQKIFDHLLMARAWLTLANYQFQKTVSADLIDNLSNESKRIFIVLSPIVKKLENLKKEKNDEVHDFISKHEIPKLQDVIDQQLNTSKDALTHNKKIVETSLSLYKKCSTTYMTVNDEVLNLKETDKRSNLLTQVAELFKPNQKPLLDKLKTLMSDMDHMGMTDYYSFKLLQEILKEYDLWEQQCTEQLKNQEMPDESQLQQKLLNIKNTKTGVKLQDSKHRILKEYFNNKATITDAQKILEQSKNLRVDVGENINDLQSLVNLVEEYESTCVELQKIHNVKNPVKQVFDNLKIMAQFPIKPNKIEEILSRWHVSAKWQSRAKQFLLNKFNEEQMDIDEGNKQNSRKNQYIWTLDKANNLHNEPHNDKQIYCDRKVLLRVKEKIEIVEKLKKQLGIVLKDNHDPKFTKEYLKELKEYETVDFEYEIHKVEEKIKLINDVRSSLDNDDNPIDIQWDMKLMLEAKVQVAKNLKKEFQDILDQYQDTFTKNMVTELKAIVDKADREHSLDMNRENKILDNIPFSEEWFLSTYEKLKKLTGKALHQVDFKDYIQLSTVLQEEKDCNTLLKSLSKSPDILVGAAQNIWKSLSGVKWLFEMRRLIAQSNQNNKDEIELKKVLEIDQKAKDIDIDYERELQRNSAYARYFSEFKKIVECINEFQLKFGTHEKVIKSLESNQDRLDEFKIECEQLTKVLQDHKISSSTGELDLLSNIHNFIDFLHLYNKITAEYPNKLPYDKAMILTQHAKERSVPEDLSILRQLKESVARFEKFHREYSDYKRFRERLKKSSSNQQVDARFTCKFVRRLIENSKSLAIEKDSTDDFDEKMLEDDLENYGKWRVKAEQIITKLEEDDTSMNNKENRAEYEDLKNQMKTLPVYDKDLFVQIQIFEWVFSSIDMLERPKDQEPLTLGTWESQIKQSEQYTQALNGIKNHPIYQRLLWEIELAKQVIDFCHTQKTNQKSLAAKFNSDKGINYAFFRNKHPKIKLFKMLEQAKQSKIDLAEEIRCLDVWLKDYDKFNKIHNDGTLYTDFQYERVKEIAKTMYLSPLDFSDIYHEVRERIDTADMIKLDLKKILQEHEAQSQFQVGKQQNKVKRLKFSRVQYHLKLFHTKCGIKGIKEVDSVRDKVQKSRDKLKEVSTLLQEISDIPEDQPKLVNEQLDKAKKTFTEVEIDMENEEKEVRRQLFETKLKLVFTSSSQPKMPLDEFKLLEKEFDQLRNDIQDEQLHAKFLEIKTKVSDFTRRINKTLQRPELDELQKQIESECPMIDFNQIITDKGAEILLGKRTTRPEPQSSSSDSDEDMMISTKKVQKPQPVKKTKPQESSSDSSSSGSSSSESSSSGSEEENSGSSSEGSSGSSSDSGESSEGSLNIAKNRSRRNIVPNLNSDFIYENPSIIAQQKIAQLESMTPEEKEKYEKKQRKQERRRKRKQKEKEKEKARKMKRQLEEHRAKNNRQITSRKNLSSTFDPDQPLPLGTQISQDQMLQKQLQNIKTKIRDSSRVKLMEHLQLPDTVFASLPKDELKTVVQELENEIFIKNSEVDHYYRKRIGDITENIKYLQAHKEIAELICAKKHLNFQKLVIPHHAFKETVAQIEQTIKQRKQQIKLQKKQLQKRQNPEQEQPQPIHNDDVTIPKEQQMLSVLYGGSESTKPVVQTKQEILKVKKQQPDSDDDDLESYDSNPALFSDEEEVPPQQQQQNIQAQYDPYQSMQQQQQLPMMTGGNTIYGDYPMQQMPMMKVQYNPYEILQTRYGRFQQKKQQEPILYDPMKAKQIGKKSEKNNAPPGSLLKVWDGIMELAKDNQVNMTLYSNIDIQVFQQLPEIPHTLQLKGKAKMQDVTSHFLRLKKDKRVIKGWCTRKNQTLQENNDKYSKIFDELDQTEKVALFNVFQGVNIYVLPITQKTREFCKQMGIEVQAINQKEQNSQEIDQSEETHCFAFLSQIKQSFNTKTNFLNPDVLRVVEVQVQPSSQDQKNDQSFSPITSDEEDNIKKQQAQILQNVKSEPIQQPDLSTIVKQDQDVQMKDQSQLPLTKGEDEDDIDINELINGFKNQEYDIQSIQAKLLPIIHKVKGEKEQKLTQFLQDLIFTLNNQPQQPIKQEQPPVYQQPPQQQPMSVGYVAPIGNQIRPGPPSYQGGIPPQQQQPIQMQNQRFPPQGQLQQPMQPNQQQFMGYRQQFPQQQQQPNQFMGQIPPQIRPQQNMFPQNMGQPQFPQQLQQQRQQFPGQQPMFQQNSMGPGNIPQMRPGQMLPGQLRPGPQQQQPPQGPGMMGMYNPQQQQQQPHQR